MQLAPGSGPVRRPSLTGHSKRPSTSGPNVHCLSRRAVDHTGVTEDPSAVTSEVSI
ncbi:hypothetical protein HSR121_1081 [Halapricum desulfuricans]|uniref:Uncharacterized protein n=1 Tax=Halapricum desulfuricans TaxID=2841257 RepID=A0A897MZK5_9EURY|nr:hypothetical protein HSR121_1081 [Halapricum desulfuricans]